jgi:hypothetical protein
MKLAGASLWAIRIVVFVKRDLYYKITRLKTSTVATGLAKVIGNKGGAGQYFFISFTTNETQHFMIDFNFLFVLLFGLFVYRSCIQFVRYKIVFCWCPFSCKNRSTTYGTPSSTLPVSFFITYHP